MKFRVLTETPPNFTEVHGDSVDLRMGSIRAQIFTCIRFESIKHLAREVITLQRGYRADFWRCSSGGATSWSTPPEFPQIVKDSGPVIFFCKSFRMFLSDGHSGQQDKPAGPIMLVAGSL